MSWLIVALVLQGFVVQTHLHAIGARDGAVAAPSATIAAAIDSRRHDPAPPTCPLCQEQALFGAYLLAGPVVLCAPADAVHDHAAAALPLFALSSASHAWHSRAPPILTA